MYNFGEGVPQDYKKTVKLVTLAAEWGKAQNNLGLICEDGKGVPKDYIEAYMWYIISAANGSETVIKLSTNVAKQMTPSQIEKAQDLARECVKKK